MHGVITFDVENNLIIVKGYLNWLVISLSVLFLIVAPLIWLADNATRTDELWLLRLIGYLVGSSLILGFLYLIEKYRFIKIVTTAAELWSRKYAAMNERA